IGPSRSLGQRSSPHRSFGQRSGPLDRWANGRAPLWSLCYPVNNGHPVCSSGYRDGHHCRVASNYKPEKFALASFFLQVAADPIITILDCPLLGRFTGRFKLCSRQLQGLVLGVKRVGAIWVSVAPVPNAPIAPDMPHAFLEPFGCVLGSVSHDG